MRPERPAVPAAAAHVAWRCRRHPPRLPLRGTGGGSPAPRLKRRRSAAGGRALVGAAVAAVLLLAGGFPGGQIDAGTDAPALAAVPAAAAAVGVPQPRPPPTVQGAQLETFQVNGLTMRVALAGPEEGPLVLLIHGWPDLWYGWRFQLPALAAAGYRVAAPDMRGFGGTDAPADASEYILPRIEEDVLGLLRAIRRDSCVLVGHDFGAKAVFGLGMRNPQVFPALVSVAVPYLGHKPTVSILEERFGNPRDRDSNFSYILSHQLPEVAAAYDADVRECLRTIHGTIPGGDVDSPPKVVSEKQWVDGQPATMLERVGRPKTLPSWLTEEDLDYYAGEYARRGFAGSLNWYRALDLSYNATRELDGEKIQQPLLVLLGDADPSISMLFNGIEGVAEGTRALCTGAVEVEVVQGAGHWLHQEAAEAVNRRLLAFLESTRP